MNADEYKHLIDRLRAGDAVAFDTVYAAEKAGLYGFLLRLSRDRNVAADLFQNVWLKLAKHASSLRADSNVRAWLYTVARREYVSFRRAQALDLSRLLVLGLFAEEGREDDALDAQLLALKAACNRLSDSDREVLLLTSAERVDSDQAAQILGISNVALRQRLARARRRLSALIELDHARDEAAALEKGARG